MSCAAQQQHLFTNENANVSISGAAAFVAHVRVVDAQDACRCYVTRERAAGYFHCALSGLFICVYPVFAHLLCVYVYLCVYFEKSATLQQEYLFVLLAV